MNHKIKIISFLVSTILLSGVGYVLSQAASFGICPDHAWENCRMPLIEIGEPLFIIFGALSLILLLLVFLAENVFLAWKRLLLWTLPVVAILIIITPAQCHAPLNLCFERERVSMLLATLILIISLLIILIKSIQLHRQKTAARP